MSFDLAVHFLWRDAGPSRATPKNGPQATELAVPCGRRVLAFALLGPRRGEPV